MNQEQVYGEKMLGFESPVVTEIDSLEEFKYIEYQLKEYDSPLRRHLDKVI